MFHKLTTTWNQTGWHDYEIFLTSCFHAANVKLRYWPLPATLSVISPVRTPSEGIACTGGQGGRKCWCCPSTMSRPTVRGSNLLIMIPKAATSPWHFNDLVREAGCRKEELWYLASSSLRHGKINRDKL